MLSSSNPLNLQSLSISIPPDALWLIFAVLVLIAATVSTILLYHWKRYGQNILSIGLVTIIYLAGIALLVVLTGMFIASYISSL